MAGDSGHPGMLTTALVLGIIGGVFGIIGALAAMFLGGLGAAFAAEGAGEIVGLGFAAVFIGVVGIVGGALARGASKTAALLLLLSGVAGFIAVSMAWLIAGPLLIAGAILAWFGRKKKRAVNRQPSAAEPKPVT
ncbi:hypothetical protein ACFQZ2_01990 [Streptomonospora algeriensis]|uniref:DUF4064 domain-containing protein n=1 Tax=Streptomonospora algeriensis TaxID=995084 RepID=A0ABW3BAY2_9ACTN